MKAPELLAPGGSFAAACQAFEAGADGIYLGLGEFSARKAAANFSLEQLRRVLGLARRLGRRIYVTVNTVIGDDEMERVASLLTWLEALEIDGVIVQDLGVCLLLARSFPRLAIHASTQMAIHNDSGLRVAEELGIRRVILSRELTLERIRDLRARHPRIELEVFIHGALCYGFSGVCLASWALAGRSANRGDCAQICRSVFCREDESADRARRRNPFSCRDLSLGSDVLKLAEIGIDALKIEGRMKSPEYAFHVTRLYREILDSRGALSEERLEELQKNAETTFSREKTRGFFAAPRGESLLTGLYPGHKGTLLGTVGQTRGRQIGLTLRSRMSLHDGIGYWPPASREPVIFPALRITRGGRSVKFAEAGDAVLVPVAEDAPLPSKGAEVRLFSSRFLDRREIGETSIPAYRIPLELKVTLREKAGDGTLSFTAAASTGSFSFSRGVPIFPSTGGKPFHAVLWKHLGESGKSLFSLTGLAFENQTGRAETEIFVPPSELKKVRNEIFAAIDGWFLESVDARARAAAAAPRLAVPPISFPPSELAKISRRNLLSPPSARPVPFVSLSLVRAGPSALSAVGGFFFVPLPPVMPDDHLWPKALRRLSEAHPESRFAIGLNNVGHLELAAGLADRENLFFYADFFLYVANRQTLSLLDARIENLLFAFSWIEGGKETLRAHASDTRDGDSSAVVRIADDYSPPLFYSLGCYARHAAGGGSCPADCPRDFIHELRQGRNRFTLVARDCVTYLFHKEK
jgi:U32 family peptidase